MLLSNTEDFIGNIHQLVIGLGLFGEDTQVSELVDSTKHSVYGSVWVAVHGNEVLILVMHILKSELTIILNQTIHDFC